MSVTRIHGFVNIETETVSGADCELNVLDIPDIRFPYSSRVVWFTRDGISNEPKCRSVDDSKIQSIYLLQVTTLVPLARFINKRNKKKKADAYA